MFIPLVRIMLANLHAADLAADSLRQLVCKLYDTRIFVGSGGALDMLLQLLDEVVTGTSLPVLAQHDGGLDNHAAKLVRHAGDGALHH